MSAEYPLSLTEAERLALARLLEDALSVDRDEDEAEYHVMVEHDYVLLRTLAAKVGELKR